jgi:nicotinate-nucleotide adenylyltransferase
MTRKDIAIFGGTFDPVHIGHYEIVKYFVDNYIVDEVWVLPSYESPHKDIDTKKSFDDRVDMLKLAFKDLKSVVINAFEEDYYNSTKEKTYSYEVLNALKKKYLNCRFHFVVGFDSIKNIHTWHNYVDLIRDYWFYIFDREDNEFKTIEQKKNYLDNLGKNFGFRFIYEMFDIKITDISSTHIRELLLDYKNNDEELKKYLNNNVLKYILENKLYGT